MYRSRTLRRCSASLIAVAAAACAGNPLSPARPVAGCYRMVAVSTGSAPELEALPDSVRLYPTRGISSLESGQAVLRAWPDSARSAYAWSWWTIAAPDTLTLVFSTGFSGVRVALRPRDGGFAGSAAAFSDAQPAPLAEARAWLTPIACGMSAID